MFPYIRPRRLRQNKIIRDMLSETHLNINNFIYPIFIHDSIIDKSGKVSNLFNIKSLSINQVLKECENLLNLGINKILLFGVIDSSSKDLTGSIAIKYNNVIQTALRLIKEKFNSEIFIITDLCLCEYTSNGQCGIMNGNIIENDSSLKLLIKQAITHIKSGSDMIAPSGMIDGTVVSLRKAFEREGLYNTPIMSYSSKFASLYFSPFRNIANSSPGIYDRKNHQLPISNRIEAINESILDEKEGADILMVKPALPYLDIIRDIKEKTSLPIAGYQTSGEYAMLKQACESNFFNEKAIVIETITSIKRAGCSIIISYYSKEIAKWLKEI